jgi:hypothetical protein
MAPSPVPDDLLDSWQGTLSQWSNKLVHDTLLGRAVKHDQLAWLATRYREAARCNPYDPIARDRLKVVQRAATMLAFAAGSATREEPRKSRGGPALLAAVVISTCLGLWLTDFVRGHQPHAHDVSAHVAAP